MILIPLYCQEVRGESVIVTGLLVGPQGIGMLMVSPWTARVTQRFGGGRVAMVGVGLLCLTTLPLAFVGTNTSIVGISLLLVIRGVGIGLSFLPATTVAFAALRTDQLSDATPQMNVLQRVGGAIGTAVLAVVLQRESVGARAPAELASAFGTAYWWALGISAFALIPVIVLLRAGKAVADPVGDGSRGAGGGRSLSRSAPELTASREEAVTELRGAFRQAFRRLRTLRGRDTHRGDEIGHAQFELLVELCTQGPLNAGELAEAVGASAATVSGMLDNLCAAELVERSRSESDRRLVVVRLTRRGRRKVEARKALWRRRWDDALEGVDANELRIAARVLDRIGDIFVE